MAHAYQQTGAPHPTGRVDVSQPLIVPTREGYDRWAHIYDDEDNPLIAMETARFRQLLGDVQGLTIADIGCGTGRQTVAMAASGANVTAVDFSVGMMSKARAKPEAANVKFVQQDLARGLPFASQAFDRVTCCLVLDHIIDLTSVLGDMARICRPTGFVLISVFHPAMLLQGIQAQFTDPSTGQKIRPASRMHQISDYVMAATRAELYIDHMSEYAVDADVAARSPRARKYMGWPLLLLMRLRGMAG